MRMTSKGQVTIPQVFRRKLGWGAGTDLSFALKDNKIVVDRSPKKAGKGQELVARLKGKAERKMTTDEILALTRG